MEANWTPGGLLAVLEVRGEDSARAVLYGRRVSGQGWASVPCEASLAEGGSVTFERPGEDPRDAAEPSMFRIWSRGKLLRECVIREHYVVLPGDTLTVYVPRPSS